MIIFARYLIRSDEMNDQKLMFLRFSLMLALEKSEKGQHDHVYEHIKNSLEIVDEVLNAK